MFCSSHSSGGSIIGFIKELHFSGIRVRWIIINPAASLPISGRIEERLKNTELKKLILSAGCDPDNA